ncbi:MAG: alpha-hydroxy-acid oxidizing protein [Treponema sp.]|nr:alpha-hydroxy-acid oxidizing protein [Treponema sp.]
MGGVNGSRNFILNCAGWDKLPADTTISVLPEHIGIAPVTGAVQNIGYSKEEDFYLPYFTAAKESGIAICVGDGAPDEKLMLGIKAVRELNEKAYFFFKPYPDERIYERIEWAEGLARAIGMDIDAYNIITMRNQAKLERKSARQIAEIRKRAAVPFIIKGVFTEDDIRMCEETLPDIIVVSNHGGRVDTEEGSTAEFLQKNASRLLRCCGELWVDGGIRKARDIQAALTAGAKKCLVGRPFLASLANGGILEMKRTAASFLHV